MSVCQAQNRSGTPDEFRTNSVTLCEVSQTNACKLIRQTAEERAGAPALPRWVQAASTQRRRSPALIKRRGQILPENMES